MRAEVRPGKGVAEASWHSPIWRLVVLSCFLPLLATKLDVGGFLTEWKGMREGLTEEQEGCMLYRPREDIAVTGSRAAVMVCGSITPASHWWNRGENPAPLSD